MKINIFKIQSKSPALKITMNEFLNFKSSSICTTNLQMRKCFPGVSLDKLGRKISCIMLILNQLTNLYWALVGREALKQIGIDVGTYTPAWL